MADEPITDTDATVTESNAAEPGGGKPKTRAPRRKSVPKEEKTESDVAPNAAKVGRGSTKTSTIAAKSEDDIGTRSSNRKRSKYTPAQRASILASIEKATRGGKTTLKAALQQANVSEQTYYNWKNAAVKQPSVPAAGSSADDLATLVALEAENLKLRKELAAKLRAENEELRRRLGLS